MKTCVLMLFSCLALSAFAEEKTYPIACWTCMRFEEQTRPVEQIVKDWKDLGITHPLMPVTCGRTGKQAVLHMLDLCHRYDLHALMCEERVYVPAMRRLQRTGDEATYRKGVAERDAGGRQAHSAGRYLAPGQLLLVKLAKGE